MKSLPLEWTDLSEEGEAFISAPTSFDTEYYITHEGSQWQLRHHHDTLGTFDTIDEAQVAGQADYTKRVHSAIS